MDSTQADTVKREMMRVKAQISEVIRGKGEVVDQILICLLSGGHVLIEDLPGMGKTTLAYTLSCALAGKFNRIQFTSDLLPADVLGVSIYDDSQREFVFQPGPVFTNILLADEINRTTPKTQSALLEVMDRGKVSMEGLTRSVGEPFMVFATQNPVDFEGTFPLPDSQMDRFLMRLEMGYPSFEDEMEILNHGLRHYDRIQGEPVVDLKDILIWQTWVDEVYIEDSVMDYLLKIITATRTESEFRNGISPRGGLALKAASQARALYHGRDYILPDDVDSMLFAVCAHRLTTRSRGSDLLEERHQVETILRRILEHVPVPG